MKRTAAVTALAISFAAMAGATTASAQNDDRASCSDTTIYLNDDWGCVVTHGDHLKVSDLTWDGNGTRLHWRSSKPNEHGETEEYCEDYNGSENGTRDCDDNFPEPTSVTYRLEQISDGDVVDWTSWHNVEV